MKDYTKIFDRKRIIEERLEPFGFTKRDGGYVYSELILNGDFRADVTVDGSLRVAAAVTDMSDGEEYLPVSVDIQTGSFVGKVREAFSSVLGRIAEECCENTPFLSEQANRIAKRIYERYGEGPDYPFSRLPECGVFRYPENGKWYAIVMNVKRSKVTQRKGDDDIIEVMNVKAESGRTGDLLKINGIYSAYHMNKKSWISLILDDTLPDDTVMELIENSRGFALKKGVSGAQDSAGPSVWIVPANPAYYDIESAFEKRKGVIWKQGKGIRAGDTVYMYVAAPVSAVIFRCVVTETDIPYGYADGNVRISRLMKMDVKRKYGREYCTFSRLGELGIRAVRGPRRVTDAFLRYMEE